MYLGSMFEVSKISAFENPGRALNTGGQVMSLVTNPIGNGVQSSNINSDSFFYNPEMLAYVRNWELTEAILQIFDSLVSDVLSTSNPTISTGNQIYDKDINNFISKIGLTQNILSNLKDDLFFGQRAFIIDFETSSILPVENSRNFLVVDHLGKPYKYQLINGDKNKLLDYNKLCCVVFNKKQILSKRSGNLKISDNNEINNIAHDLTYYQGNSILKSSIYLIFLHYLKSLLSTILTLRNITRPDLLKVNVQPGSNSEQLITEAVNNIESLLNQGEYSFDFKTTSPYAIISTIYNSIVNSVKVLPGLANYTDVDIMQQPDLTAKIEQLNNDVNNLKTNIVSNEGIPEELMGGSSNRWEVVSRSTRLHNRVKDIINDIALTYKTAAKNYIEYKYSKKIILDDFKFNLDTNNYLYASGLSSKLQMITDNFSRVAELSRSFEELSKSPLFNRKNAVDYIMTTLTATDSQLAGIIDYEKAIKDEAPSEDKDKSGGGSW